MGRKTTPALILISLGGLAFPLENNMRHREVWNRARMLDEKDGKLFRLDARPNERGSDASARRTKNKPNGNPTCCSFSCAWHAKDEFRARFYRLPELISFDNHPQCFDERCRLKNLFV